jgi:hypothetical protein
MSQTSGARRKRLAGARIASGQGAQNGFPSALGVSETVGSELPIDVTVLSLLRMAGGKLNYVDLDFELRWRGVLREQAISTLDSLVRNSLVRGPSKTLAYELTADGWDVAASLARRGFQRRMSSTG